MNQPKTTGSHHMPLSSSPEQQSVIDNERGTTGAAQRLAAICQFFALGMVLLFLLAGPLRAEDEEVVLNFKDADLNVVIQTVAEITGRNFVIDPRVKGKVTVVSSRPMAADELYQVFLSVLEVHGFAAIPDGDVTRIVPAANAKQAGLPVVVDSRRGGPTNDMITQVIQIKHVSAAQLVPVLRPLVPPQGHMAAYQATNTLIISDRAANIVRLKQRGGGDPAAACLRGRSGAYSFGIAAEGNERQERGNRGPAVRGGRTHQQYPAGR